MRQVMKYQRSPREDLLSLSLNDDIFRKIQVLNSENNEYVNAKNAKTSTKACLSINKKLVNFNIF